MTDISRAPLALGISIHPTGPVWALVTARSTYALGVTNDGLIVNLHWGARLATLGDLPTPILAPERSSQDTLLSAIAEEYPAFGGLRYGELAAHVQFADGVRDLDLRYQRFTVDQDNPQLPRLTLHLCDQHYPLTVALHYEVDITRDLIIRSAEFINAGSEPIRLERAFSAAWHLPATYSQRVLTTLAGQWAAETQIQRRPLVAGTELVESRRGTTSNQALPWLALETQPTLGLNSTEIYFGTLAWSGNWMLRVTSDVTGHTTLVGGISDHDFAWQLASGTTFTTPDFIAGFADDGLNGVRQRLHDYTRALVLPRTQIEQPRPILYNSWEATFFDVSEPGQMQLAEQAAKLGIELFVVDDGWFVGRVADTAGLGDWRADPAKFPRGLGPLAEHVNALGMQFGLWVEPEMVNRESELYRAHPEWIYSFPTRAGSEARHQLVLNFGREDVRAYLFDALNTLLTKHPIVYLKWDMNRPISEPGWSDYLQQGGEAREVWVRHTLGIYALMDELRERHPYLSIEACAGGGGRADLGVLRRTDQIWASDNTHPEARLLIQEGFSLAFPARVMTAWVTDAGRDEIPLSFRFHVSMMGTLGIGGNLVHWSAAELEEAAHWIAVYKTLRPLVQNGDQAWLLSPHATRGQFAAVQYTARAHDQAIVLLFRRGHALGEPAPALRLCNLDPAALYRVEDLSTFPVNTVIKEEEMSVYSGAALMARGLTPLPSNLRTYTSCLLRLHKVASTNALA